MMVVSNVFREVPGDAGWVVGSTIVEKIDRAISMIHQKMAYHRYYYYLLADYLNLI